MNERPSGCPLAPLRKRAEFADGEGNDLTAHVIGERDTQPDARCALKKHKVQIGPQVCYFCGVGLVVRENQ